MHYVNFYKTFPVIETIVCLFFGLGVPIKIIKKIKCEAAGFNLNFIKNIALLFLGILMLAAGLHGVFSYCNSHKTVLISLTEGGILLPTETFFCTHENLVIPWKNITKIQLKEYSTFSYSRHSYCVRTHHHTYLYFNYVDSSGKSSIASINFKCLDVSSVIFFTELRKFYSGPIYKKIGMEAGKLQVLKSSTDNQLMWENS